MSNALSGSAVGPLVAAMVEGVSTPCPMLTSRLSIEFLRPVPMAPLRPAVQIVREGRKQQVVHVSLHSQDHEVVNATAVRVRTINAAARVRSSNDFTPPKGVRFVPTVGVGLPLLSHIQSHVIRSNDGGPGETEAWLRYDGQIIEGRASTPFTLAAMFADFGNGLAPVVAAENFTFLNAELSIHLSRAPEGKWFHLVSRTFDGQVGLGTVHTQMSDSQGLIGWAHQTLLFQPRY